ncbi:hypothetical protein [Chitinophaga sp. CF418]|uniref:hypothetical protein n=1 Tax=Chitinophaga sp. CF418 TaxID=1855287 RepID=UPI00122D4C54|nr:hypothetical protein [Chitinophaga sp. CF418]
MILTSCSKKTADTNSSPRRLTKAELYADLKAFNAAHGVRPECSGFWSCLGKVAAVAGADITGAAAGVVGVSEAAGALGIATGGTGAVVVMAAGGAIAGGGASYAAAKAVYTAVAPNENKYGDLNLDVPLEFHDLSDVGIKHNNAMYNIFFAGQEVTDSYYTGALGVGREYLPVLNNEIYQQRVAAASNLGRDYVSSGFDYAFLTNRAYETGLITDDMRQILYSFMEAYGTGADMENVINHYISAVDQSELTDIERKALIAGFIVASESPYVFYNNVNEK